MGAFARLGLASVLTFGRPRQRRDRLAGFPHSLERRRSRHPDTEASRGGVRQVAVLFCICVAMGILPTPTTWNSSSYAENQQALGAARRTKSIEREITLPPSLTIGR